MQGMLGHVSLTACLSSCCFAPPFLRRPAFPLSPYALSRSSPSHSLSMLTNHAAQGQDYTSTTRDSLSVCVLFFLFFLLPFCCCSCECACVSVGASVPPLVRMTRQHRRRLSFSLRDMQMRDVHCCALCSPHADGREGFAWTKVTCAQTNCSIHCTLYMYMYQ